MEIEERIKGAETHQFRMVLPNSSNDNGVMFGGYLLQWMDEVAYITAQRFTRMRMVTIAVGDIRFCKPIFPGSMIELIGTVRSIGNVKLEIGVEIYKECLEDCMREKVLDGVFTFAAVSKDHKPISIQLERKI